MLIKLISSFFLLTFLSGCANIAPQDIPTEIQKTNNVGQLVLTTSTPIFYVFDLKAIDSSPTDGYITFFTNAVAISYYAGRVVTSKVFNKLINLLLRVAIPTMLLGCPMRILGRFKASLSQKV